MRQRVYVLPLAGEEGDFARLSKQHGTWINFLGRSRDGGRSNLVVLQTADAVLTIGGSTGTHTPGMGAVLAGRPVVPVGSFGGASQALLRELLSQRVVPSHGDLGALLGAWGQHCVDVIRAALTDLASPQLVIVHGRSGDWRKLKDFLQNQVGAKEPIVMQQLPGVGLTLPEKWERLAQSARGAIALVNPDDYGALKGASSTEDRARQNVWLEVGWFWGRLGRGRIMLLVQGSPSIPSDLSGLEPHIYQNSPLECSEAIRAFYREVAKTITPPFVVG